MIPIFYCPDCIIKLNFETNNLLCTKCKKNFLYKNKIGIFSSLTKYQEPNTKIKKLNDEIKIKGYSLAIENFTNKNLELKSNLINTKYDRSVDSIFHCINNNNQRVLEIKSELGNKTESLSNIFEQVYSIEFDEKLIEFQKIRFKQRKCDNIIILKCDLFKLPFPDNFFDMVLCNNLLETVTKFYKENDLQNQNKIINELKRVINLDGKIIFGINNKYGIKASTTKSLQNQEKNTLKQNYSNFDKLLKKNGLHVNPYWIFPSYEKPYFSGKLSDDISLKWFFNNLDNLVGKHTLSQKKKILLSIIKKLNYPLIQELLKNFSPSFVFCCGKVPLKDTLENWIEKDTKYENYLMISRRMKILFILLNKKGLPENIISVKRYGNKFPTKLKKLERKFPEMKDPEEKAWIEEWFSGNSLNPLDLEQVILAIKWLINFQNNSRGEVMNENDIMNEIELVKKGLQNINHGNVDKYHEWLNQYKNYISKNKIFKTAVHGDFWITNILFESKKNKIHVLDWELFIEKGNPLLDFLIFLYDVMAMTEKNPLETFRNNLQGNGKASMIIDKIKLMMEEHFGFKLDIILLLRFYLMKKMVPKKEEMIENIPKDNPIKNKPTLYMEMLDMLSK